MGGHMDHHAVTSAISRLETDFRVLKSRHLGFRGVGFRDLWTVIKEVGAGFKGTHFPSAHAREEAWNRFQQTVQEIKNEQEYERAYVSRISESAKYDILKKANSARP